MDPRIRQRFLEALGAEGTRSDPADLARYGQDETEDLVFPPELVVLPRRTEEVSAVLRLCSEHRIPVTPRGAGTGLAGGALPVQGGIVMSLERMDRILDIDTQGLVAVVEPGVITEVLQNEVEKAGLFYPPDPASRGSCLIGGNIAHGAGGPRAVKYGTTRDYVLGIEAVLASGAVIRSGGKLRKYASGYPLHQLLVGSEGTLAVVTQATLRLVPLPAARATLLAPFATLSGALATIPAIFQKGIVPSAAEFLERDAMLTTASHLGIAPPAGAGAKSTGFREGWEGAEGLLLLEVDGMTASEVEREAELLGELCLTCGALDVLVAEDPPRQRELWRLRRAVGEAVKSLSPYREIDAVVPLPRIAELVAGAKERTRARGLDAICYGHAGDGNIHVNVLKRDLPDAEWRARIDEAAADLYRFIGSLGGAISGEHGVGYVGRGHLASLLGEDTVALMRALKSAFDPLGILNPGKIF